MSALRGYQAEALAALYAGWDDGLRRIGVSLPTGTGKTHVMAHLTKREAEAPGPERVLWLLHRDELVHQSVAKLRATLDPRTSIGVIKADRNELGARVLVASVHSLRSARRREMLPPISTCIVDEAHVSVSPTYRSVFDRIGADAPGGARLAGFSATWSRSDSTGLGDVWQDVVYARTIRWAVKAGHLVEPRALQVGDGVDTAGVAISRATGDFRESQLEEVVMLESLRDKVVEGVLRHGGSRPGVLFAPTVASAEYFAQALRGAGITVEGIYHDTSPTERRRRFAEHREGRVRLLATCTALAEGWDAPHCALGVLVRPTRHEGLFVQLFGRLLRPWPGKHDALLLDFVGATDDVRLRNAIDLTVTRATDTGEQPIDDEFGGLDEPDEPVSRETLVRRIHSDHEVEVFAGTPVQWLTSRVGLPFVPCGDTMVFVVEGRDGWCVGHVDTRVDNLGQPRGQFVATGLSQGDALQVASDYAEDEGQYLARRASAWRAGPPSDQQIRLATQLGITGAATYSKGALSDDISVALASRVLAPIAHWSLQQRNEYSHAS